MSMSIRDKDRGDFSAFPIADEHPDAPNYVPCGFCQIRRGVTTDHFITKNQVRRNPKLAAFREDSRFKVRACSECNQAKGTRLRVPANREYLIEELQALTGDAYGGWDGTPEGLREVVRR